jgi:hypothetical protein
MRAKPITRSYQTYTTSQIIGTYSSSLRPISTIELFSNNQFEFTSNSCNERRIYTGSFKIQEDLITLACDSIKTTVIIDIIEGKDYSSIKAEVSKAQFKFLIYEDMLLPWVENEPVLKDMGYTRVSEQ